MQETVHELIEHFWKGIGITMEKLDIDIDNENVNIRVETPDSALIIGIHGRSLESFVHILSRMIEKSTGQFLHIHLEVNDYVKSKDERLYRFLDSKIDLVMSTGKSLRIPNLNSYDRKKAHNYISEKNITGLATHSEGTGTERALMIEYTGVLKTSTISSSEHSTLDDLSEEGVGI